MKFACLGFLDPAKMDARPPEEIDAILSRCAGPMAELRATGQLVMDAGVGVETKCLRRANGALQVTDGSFTNTEETLGSVFIIEARNMEEAIRVVSLHPTVRLSAGEQFGWRLEIRPVHHFGTYESSALAGVPLEA